jgi:hypothetical protein
MHRDPHFNYRKRRREAVLRKMAAMRAAKERRRMEREPVEDEPKMERWHRFEFGVRDKTTGETAWHDLVSVRHAAKALGLILKHL